MFSFLRKRITAERAAMALYVITEDLKEKFVVEVFPEAVLPDIALVKAELCFLAMYIIDARLKMMSEGPWGANKDIIANHYYTKCAESSGVEKDTYLWSFYEKIKFYNQGISAGSSEIAGSSSSDDRFATIGANLGELFAQACNCPGDGQHIMVGSGAYVAVNTAIEGLLAKFKIIA